MRLVPIECVKEGAYLAKTIFDDEGRPLLREGVKLSKNMINRIKSIHIYSVYIIDEYSQAEIDDIIKPELRQKAIGTIKGTFSSIDKFSKAYPSKSNNSLIKEREKYFDSIYSVAEELLEEILSNSSIMVNLVDIKSLDSYTYQHCVNVAVLSLILGIQLQLNKYDLLDLCVGALVHDIGKSFVPAEVLFKPGPLNDQELLIMQEHVTKGYDYLRGVLAISSKSRIIALQHHEKYDGSGYPEQRKGTEINYLARIVAIADVYDALTSDRPYRRALSPNESMEYIMANASTHFDYDMVKAFARVIVPYPKGTLVKMSNGEIAVVGDTIPNFPLRPNITVVKSSDPSREGTEISLVKNLSLVIENVEYEI
ncbi:HD-GYP domain-containing protein [Clostridium sp. MSJ-4]|uniref:HD-GYP domain-containing protein n=1 Tax=Clostridium simiarum TaxID=2841506 RepID=A0ABS6F3K3_9CLOT|nr:MULTISPECIES: HD-GYP domain-containing protein [Clostridium]MBU5592193.1 HD-GYP domain-containing protein [Clostridium simiarum]